MSSQSAAFLRTPDSETGSEKGKELPRYQDDTLKELANAIREGISQASRPHLMNGRFDRKFTGSNITEFLRTYNEYTGEMGMSDNAKYNCLTSFIVPDLELKVKHAIYDCN